MKLHILRIHVLRWIPQDIYMKQTLKKKKKKHVDIDDTETNGALCKILMCLAFICNVI